MIFLFFTSPLLLAPLEAEICPIEVWHGIFIILRNFPTEIQIADQRNTWRDDDDDNKEDDNDGEDEGEDDMMAMIILTIIIIFIVVIIIISSSISTLLVATMASVVKSFTFWAAAPRSAAVNGLVESRLKRLALKVKVEKVTVKKLKLEKVEK